MTIRKTFAQTQEQLAEMLQMPRPTLRTVYMKKNGFPSKTDRGWDVDEVAQFITDEKESQRPGDGSLRDLKLKREIEKLEIQIQKMRRELIPMTDHLQEITTYAQMVMSSFDEFESIAAAEFPQNPRMLELAQGISDRVKRLMLKKIDGFQSQEAGQ